MVVGMADHDRLAMELGRLPLFERLNRGEGHTITEDEVHGLFDLLDVNHTGALSKEDLQVLQQVPGVPLTSADVDEIVAECDRSGDGVISRQEFVAALLQGKAAFRRLMGTLRGTHARTRGVDECRREDMLRYLKYQFHKDDACFSLPFTLLFFCIFLVVLYTHGRIETQFDLQRTVQKEISGEGGLGTAQGPYIDRDVHDVVSFWEWLRDSFVSASFRNDLLENSVPGRVAGFNQMVGGVRLRKKTVQPQACSQSDWLKFLYDSRDVSESCHSAGSALSGGAAYEDESSAYLLYHKTRAELVEEVQALKDARWVDYGTTQVDVEMLLYNAQVSMFDSFRLRFEFQRDGYVRYRFLQECFDSDPYRTPAVYVLDAIFIFMLVKMAYSEAKELLPAVRNGWDGFVDYLGFWNVIDWVSVFAGVALIVQWSVIVRRTGQELKASVESLPTAPLEALLHEEGRYLTGDEVASLIDVTELNSKLGQMFDVASGLSVNMFALRVVLAVYVVVMMLRFFKAFRANPRLNVVTETLLSGAVDIAHFFVVFFTIFMSFSVCGSVLFGPKMREFSSLIRSLNMGFRILLGEFDFASMERVNVLFATVWFWAFNLLVLLVLFNMLLAIVMDTYSAVKGRDSHDSDTIWKQAVLTYRQLEETKGHLDLWFLVCEFEDDNAPAHPDLVVTPRSLRRAFPKMSRHNAEYLVRQTNSMVHPSRSDDVTLVDALRLIVRVEQCVQSMAKQMAAQTELQSAANSGLAGLSRGLGGGLGGFSGGGLGAGDVGDAAQLALSAPPRTSMGTIGLPPAVELNPESKGEVSLAMRPVLPGAATDEEGATPTGAGGPRAVDGGDRTEVAIMQPSQVAAGGDVDLSALLTYFVERDRWLDSRLTMIERKTDESARAAQRVSAEAVERERVLGELEPRVLASCHKLELKALGLRTSVAEMTEKVSAIADRVVALEEPTKLLWNLDARARSTETKVNQLAGALQTSAASVVEGVHAGTREALSSSLSESDERTVAAIQEMRHQLLQEVDDLRDLVLRKRRGDPSKAFAAAELVSAADGAFPPVPEPPTEFRPPRA